MCENVLMLRHSDIWRAIDRLAKEKGLSPSGLARTAGLDATTFNRSKRVTREGKLRWPSTESIAKILDATGASLGEFLSYVAESEGGGFYANFPVIGFARAGVEGYFDDAGYPIGGGWEEIPFPDIGDAHAYALEISGESMEPVYRDGDVIIVSPNADIRRGDRVVLKTRSGEVMAKLLRRRTARKYELISFNPAHEARTVNVDEVEWVGRIVWASQ
jgi:phage repressor protein C with HTH and peptisase S24 domain